ncbi:CD9 antigen isoform X1 [Salmo salar]|uniref:Tetraspanin n=1 Tax=Salmo salar TaxID=8030 RepID=Q8AYJ0_SALSA|nr:CD9 antigen [Salmo salar]XP_014048608.1 CD9 antigen isoform X1 [Salmo salar]XP_014048609.1 CD9 antigen isoform X1 [Salmo salar]AAN63554.1 CD9 protein [Salmo salar]ACI33197.1 CD9 antigen [Salmo salar]|eukprot:NP_001117013.1 CD9 antigen [Salmo salar]
MALDGCGQLCKCILLLFNIIFALVGFVMFGLGLWLRFSSETRGLFNIDLNTQQFVSVVSVLIVLGAVMLLVAVFGDYGACNENKTALEVSSCLLSFLTVLVIGAGGGAYVMSDEVGKQVAIFYTTVYAQYLDKQDPGLAVTLSMFHNVLHCCGLLGGLDLLVKITCPITGFLGTLAVPACPTVIINLLESKAPLVIGLFLGTAAMMITAVVCCSILVKQIKRSHLSAPVY